MDNTKNKITYSKCDSRKVKYGLDHILHFRDEYLFATLFKGCRPGWDRGDDCYYVPHSQNDSILDRIGNWLGHVITCELVLCVVVWYWLVYLYLEYDCNFYAYEEGYWSFFFFMGALPLVLICILYAFRLKKYSKPLCDDIGRDRLLWQEKDNRIRGILRDITYRIRRRSTWHTALCVVPLWACAMGMFLYYGVLNVRADKDWSIAISLMVVIYVVYKRFLGAHRILLREGEEDPDLVLWEVKAGHLGNKPVFFGLSGRKALRNLTSLKHAYQTTSAAKELLDRARDLSWLDCLCSLSEEMKKFTKDYDEENVNIEIRDGIGCNDNERMGKFTILLTGAVNADPDSIVPTEVKVKTQSFTLPYIIGKKTVQMYRQTGILDLSMLDECFAETGIFLKEHKDSIKKSLAMFGAAKNAAIERYMDTEIFTEVISDYPDTEDVRNLK